MKVVSAFLLGLLFFSLGCYFWSSNITITGTILKENYLTYEDIVTIKGKDGKDYVVRFQLAVDGKGGYDPNILKSLDLPGKRCIIETGPHGVVLKAIIFLSSGEYEIPKVDKNLKNLRKKKIYFAISFLISSNRGRKSIKFNFNV